MQVLRDTDYELIGLSKSVFDDDMMFYFKRRKYDDNIIGLKVLKYINVSENIVLFLNANAKKKISVSGRQESAAIEPLLSALLAKIRK